MDMDISNKYFLCVYQSGSISKAAKSLDLSQPALSMMIGNLEKKLGYKLFDRKTKPISLTAEGEIYLEYLNQQRSIQEDMQRKMADLHQAGDHMLTVGGSVVYVESLITPVLPIVHHQFPKCSITVKNAPLQELIAETEAGRMDCFISTSTDIPVHFEAIPLKQERLYLGIPKTWEINQELCKFQTRPGEKKELMDYTLLEGLPFISLMKELPLQKKMDAFWKQQHVHPKADFYVNQVSTAINLAFLGTGIVVASEEALSNTAYENYLCLYSLPEKVTDRTIYVVYDAQRYIPNISKAFIQALQENEKSSVL